MTNRRPRLSIGLPVYNGGPYLAPAIESLLGQSFEDFTLVISDNASTDHTEEVCRHYASLDARIRYHRQATNIGAAPNQDFVLRASDTELFKWVGADDLFASTLLQRCVALLDDHPDAVLAHSWTAVIDERSQVVQALEYPLATDSHDAVERFRSHIFSDEELPGSIRADDEYGVFRADALKAVRPHGSFYQADKAFIGQLVLRGRFVQDPNWLYFRRHHAERAANAHPTVRSWCTNLDPRRANRLRHPAARLYGEYVVAYFRTVKEAPISTPEKHACYSVIVEWLTDRAISRLRPSQEAPGLIELPEGSAQDIELEELVATSLR